MASNEGCNDRYDALRRLAFDLGIRWSGVNEEIWQRLNPEVWEMTHNPCLVLNAVSREQIDEHLADHAFDAQLQRVIDKHQKQLAAPTWFTTLPDASAMGQIAYFSMEYMLSESLPLYSGGLANVAGDQLKAASDLGVPVIAVGMLWQHGYFRQEIDSAGRQHALFPVNDTAQMPIEPLLRPDGSLLRLAIDLPGLTVWLRGWQVRIGRSQLLLLDSNDPVNPVPVRLITEQLYGGDTEMRLRQEIVLGIGGWRLLEAAGHQPRICHLNDGHAAFVALERARSYMRAHSVDFQVALTATRAGNLFTTHTPVSEGFDCFEPGLAKHWPGLSIDDPVFARGEAGYDIRVRVVLTGLDASLIQVQVYRSAQPPEPWKAWNLTPVSETGSGSTVSYTGSIAEDYPADFYTVRIVTKREREIDASLEAPWILWQK